MVVVKDMKEQKPLKESCRRTLCRSNLRNVGASQGALYTLGYAASLACMGTICYRSATPCKVASESAMHIPFNGRGEHSLKN